MNWQCVKNQKKTTKKISIYQTFTLFDKHIASSFSLLICPKQTEGILGPRKRQHPTTGGIIQLSGG